MCAQNLHTDVYRSFTQNCQKLEATRKSLNRWMNVLHLHNGILFINNKKMSYQTMKRHRGLLNSYLSERSQSEKAVHCVIPTI